MAGERRSSSGALYEAGQLIPGTKLRVEQYVGGGGMGSVYAATETSVHKRYVVKVIHPSLLSSAQASERMMQEAITLANLEHRNIVQVYWAGLTDESPALPFYVMERLQGYPLRHALAWYTKRALDLPLTWFFHIASGLLTALEYAHDNRIIHRDVKPDNIFIHLPRKGRPVVKLLDFGILAILSETSRTTTGNFTGTLSYAAPEQLRGERPTPAIDIYAAGLVMYEMLAGRGAFQHHTTAPALIHAHLHESPPPLSGRRSLHPRLTELIHCMLEKDPARRPGSAGDVVSALARIQTEWLGQGNETVSGEPGALQFDADIGPLWLTNAGPSDSEPEAPNRTQRIPSNEAEALAGKGLHQGDPALDVTTAGQQGAWGGTVTGRTASRRSRLALAAVGVFVGLSVGLLVLLRPFTAPSSAPSAAVPSQVALPSTPATASAVPPAPMPTAAALPASRVSAAAPTASSTPKRAKRPPVKQPTPTSSAVPGSDPSFMQP